jgi:hypothetical protein
MSGSDLLEQVRRLVHEGNVRRIVIKQDDRVVAEFPLTVGVVGAVFAPVLAAVGAMAALLTDCTMLIEREGPPTAATPAGESKGTAPADVTTPGEAPLKDVGSMPG